MPLFQAADLAGRGFVVATGQAELIERPHEIHQLRIRQKRMKAEPGFQILSAGIEGASLFRETLQFALERLSFHNPVTGQPQGRQEISGFALQAAQS